MDSIRKIEGVRQIGTEAAETKAEGIPSADCWRMQEIPRVTHHRAKICKIKPDRTAIKKCIAVDVEEIKLPGAQPTDLEQCVPVVEKIAVDGQRAQ